MTTVKDFEATQTLKFENGTKSPLLFSTAEYERRLTDLRTIMSGKNLDACIFTSYHNIAYFSNFLYCSFGRPYALVVTPDKDVTISALVDGGQPWRLSRGDNLIYTDWRKDNYLAAIKEVLGPIKGQNLAIEFDHVNLDMHKKMHGAFEAKKQLQDISQEAMAMRMVKSIEEQALYRQTSRIADLGAFSVRNMIKEGASEYEITLHGTAAMVKELASTYGSRSEIRDTWMWLQSGPENTDGAHNAVSNRRLVSGDILSLNCFPMVQGYYNALERTMILDHATDDQLKYWQANLDVHYRGIDLIKPGAKYVVIIF